MIRQSHSTFAERLKKTRELRGFKTRELSRISGLYLGAVGDIESGKVAKVSLEAGGALAESLGVSKVWLCWGEGPIAARRVKNVDESQTDS